MTLRIVRAALTTERDDTAHLARLLALLHSTTRYGDGTIDGLTKLAKMDFLVRYPQYLQRILQATRRRQPSVPIQDYERHTVESSMIRFRYGPWDARYRRWIALLVSKGLAETYLRGRTVHVRVTDLGTTVARNLLSQEAFSDIAQRSDIVASTVGRMSGSQLRRLVYQAVPELQGMAWGENIRV